VHRLILIYLLCCKRDALQVPKDALLFEQHTAGYLLYTIISGVWIAVFLVNVLLMNITALVTTSETCTNVTKYVNISRLLQLRGFMESKEEGRK
jgi:hypothetical protein